MSAQLEDERIKALAGRVSDRIAGTPAAKWDDMGGLASDLAALKNGLTDIQRRLSDIESYVKSGRARDRFEVENARPNERVYAASSPWLGPASSYADHPTQQKFRVEESAVSELVDFLEGEKKCELDPSGKPCDHCSMCNSRGF